MKKSLFDYIFLYFIKKNDYKKMKINEKLNLKKSIQPEFIEFQSFLK